MKKDQEDVKNRRHRRTDSLKSDMSVATSSLAISDEDFDEFDISQPIFSFEPNEISKLVNPPSTPLSGSRVSAVDAFMLEKDRSIRTDSIRKLSLRGSHTLGTSEAV